MSTTTATGAPPTMNKKPDAPKSVATTTAKRVAGIVAIVAGVGAVALLVLLVTGKGNEDASPTTIGFSLNSFFVWLGNLNPLLQIPLILIAFGAVVGIVLVLIEFAPRPGRGYFWLRLGASILIPVLAFMLLRPYQNAVVYVVGIALLAGALLFFADYRARAGSGYAFQLVLFLAPAATLLLVGLVWPAISTVYQSFFDKTGDEFIGLDNYIWVFTNSEGFWSVVNTLIWGLIAPIFSTVIGLAYAGFIDRAHGEKVLKVFVFMPYAISFVGAGIIWKFIYDYRQGDQIGLLNAIITMFGGQPVGWLDAQPLINTFALLAVFIWTQTGFAMVVLSAAIKAVPIEQLEAAQLDGANAWERFRNVTIPGIRTSLIVVLTTITIASLKVYDIVAVMTGGRSNSTVLAFEMVNQQQRFQSYGHSSALAVVLFLIVTPLIVYNIRQMRKQEEIR